MAADSVEIPRQRAAPDSTDHAGPKRRRHRRLRLIAKLAAAMIVAVALLVGVLRYVDPPITAFELQDFSSDPSHPWVDADYVSRNFLAALIAHEDPGFATRRAAADLGGWVHRTWTVLTGGDDPATAEPGCRCGSTIDMQLTKNLFFWRSGNTVAVALRKILELPVAELLWLEIPRKRVLELYLNTIEFGNGIYGACAASWYYFGLPPATLSVDEAAQLVGVMPNPKAFRRGTDGGIIQPPRMNTVAWAQAHVPEQIREVGGLAVLRSIGFPDTAQQHLVSHPQGASYNVMPAGVAKRLGWVS